MRTVRILQTLEELAHGAAQDFVDVANASIAARGRFTVALTGGTTPKDAYAMLATDAYASRIDWARVFVFWGDERCVPPGDAESNFRMANDALLRHVPIPPANVHRMRGEDEPDAAAAAYERVLDEVVGSRFDLINLGMGRDAHIASLFPGSAVLHEQTRRVCAAYSEETRMWRITMTPVMINAAANITFIVAGRDKADAVARVLAGPRDSNTAPAQIVAPVNGDVRWLIDAESAAFYDVSSQRAT